jgi:hypothetical protein
MVCCISRKSISDQVFEACHDHPVASSSHDDESHARSITRIVSNYSTISFVSYKL